MIIKENTKKKNRKETDANVYTQNPKRKKTKWLQTKADEK